MHGKPGYAGNCYSCTAGEFLAVLRAGQAVWVTNLGPLIMDGDRELHPRRDTLRRLVRTGVLVESGDANEVQRSAGMVSYRLAAEAGEGK